MHVVFGSPSHQPYLMSGFVTPLLNPIVGARAVANIYIVYTRIRKSVSTQLECSISNMEHSSLWFLQQLVQWEKSAVNYHSRQVAELIAIKKVEDYAKTVFWIRARTSFALLRSAIICLRGTKSTLRKSWEFRNTDMEFENTERDNLGIHTF